MKPTSESCHKAIDYFQNVSKKYYGDEAAYINRNQAKWWMESILRDMGIKEFRALVDYYFTTYGLHTMEHFAKNYHHIMKSKVEYVKTLEDRAARREETIRRTREWKERIERESQATTD